MARYCSVFTTWHPRDARSTSHMPSCRSRRMPSRPATPTRPDPAGERVMSAVLNFLPGPLDLLQILIVATAFYYVLRFLARTRAIQMLVGLLVLAMTYFMSSLLNLELIEHILAQLFQYGVIAAIIVFHPELRAALARLGQSRMIRFFNRLEEREVVEELVEAVERLTRARIGAIIAIQRDVGLDEYAATGTRIHARVGA